MTSLYAPSDYPLLWLGCIGAALSGIAFGFMGLIILKTTLPFRDAFSPVNLENQVMPWSMAAIAIGLTIHVFDTRTPIVGSWA